MSSTMGMVGLAVGALGADGRGSSRPQPQAGQRLEGHWILKQGLRVTVHTPIHTSNGLYVVEIDRRLP